MKYGFLVLTFALTACGFEVVDEGSRGIKKSLGKVEDTALNPGMHFYNPFTTDVEEFDVREKKLEIETQAYTRDTQTAALKIVATYYAKPDSVVSLYKQ